MGHPTEQILIHKEQENGLSITVHEEKGLRWLDFGDGGIQSAINPSAPRQLVLPLNQAMLAGLLFVPAPQRVLLLGTGGGAIARYFAHREPACRGDAIEQSPAVARIARQFFDFPGAGTHWTLHTAEARKFINDSGQQYDLIVLDIADGPQSPQWISDHRFLDQCRQRLTTAGVLVINLIPRDAEDFALALTPIRQAFPFCTACLSIPGQHNILVFAFRESANSKSAESRVLALSQQWDLPFKEFLQRLRDENPVGSGIF